MCTNRSSRSTASMTPVNQLSGSDATSLTPRAASVGNCAPDRFRRDRQGDIAYAKMPQRIDHRIADCGWRADRSALACPLHAEGIARRGARKEGGAKGGNIGRPRQSVIEKARGQELPG